MPKAGKILICIILFTMLTSVLAPSTTATKTPWWNESFSYKQEIIIPIDTKLEHAKFQPIDIKIDFENPCWAKNENKHSVRVIFEKDGYFKELECQIYNLKYSTNYEIRSCNLVFLTPEEANGKEKYYLYYDDEDKSGPNYLDHVKVEDSYYQYTPIPGYSVESNFFNIIDDGYSIYQISYKGKALGRGRSQYVFKLKDGSKDIKPENGDLFAIFDFSFFDENAKKVEDYLSTSDELVSKEIIVDGNLMANVLIISKSKNDEAQTTAYYKYYHCPSKDKRIHVEVKHEAKKDIKLTKKDALALGTYAHLQVTESKSKTIKELNFGKIFPYLHLYNKKDFVSEYKIDTNPKYVPPPGNLPYVISIDDNVDLGKKAWVSFDEGKEGVSNSLIFNSNSVLKSGYDEKDGITIGAYQDVDPHLPGLECKHSGVTILRNLYENNERDYLIPKDFRVEFHADFFSSKSEGYLRVQKEAEIFQELAKSKPSKETIVLTNKRYKDKNQLTVFLHNARSSQFGFGISTLTGLNVSYETVELYKDNNMVRSSTPYKIEMDQIIEDFKKTGLEDIKSFFSSFNLDDISIFKKVSFSDLEEGKYLIKIFRKNCKLSEDEKLIGFKIIEVAGDTKSHVFCRPSGMISLSVFDQNNKPVNNVDFSLKYDDICVSNSFTTDNGKVTFSTPVFLNKEYFLNANYKGFNIFEEPVKLGLKNIFRDKKINIDIKRYDLQLKLTDSLGLPCSINLNPFLTSIKSTDSLSYSDKKDNSYVFNNLLSSSYKIQIFYKNDLIEKEIDVDSNKELELVFPVEYNLNSNIFNIRGEKIDDWKIILSRMDKEMEFDSSEPFIDVPAGNYDVKAYSDGQLISKSKVEITGDTYFPIITKEQPLYPSIIVLLSIIILFSGCLILLKKKKYISAVLLVIIILCMISLATPWWSIDGISNSKNVGTSSNMYLLPTNLVTITSNSEYSSGQVSSIPDILLSALNIVITLVVSGCTFLFLYILFEKRLKKKLNLILFSLGFSSFFSSILLFSYSISEFANVAVGSFIGRGTLDIQLPLENNYEIINCSWGPNIGFYLLILAVLLLSLILVIKLKKRFVKIEN